MTYAPPPKKSSRTLWITLGIAAVLCVIGTVVIALAEGEGSDSDAADTTTRAAAVAPPPAQSVRQRALAAGMAEPQLFACEDFVNGNRVLSPEDDAGKAELARKVNKWAQQAGPEFAAAGNALARVADGNAEVWRLAADTFAHRCITAGWPTK